MLNYCAEYATKVLKKDIFSKDKYVLRMRRTLFYAFLVIYTYVLRIDKQNSHFGAVFYHVYVK